MRSAAFAPAFVAVVLCAACPSMAQNAAGKPATRIMDVVAGQSHKNGKASWTSVMLSNASNRCGFSRADPRANNLTCMATSVWIDNQSKLPIKCRAGIKSDHPADSDRKPIVGNRVIQPGAMEIVATAFGEEARIPRTYATECAIATANEIPPPVAECGGKLVSAPDPDAFYPPEARRASLQGDVVLQFAIDGAAGRLRDILISESSGDRGLDLAALKVGQHARATSTTDCGGRIYRMKVKFKITESPAEQMPEAKQ